MKKTNYILDAWLVLALSLGFGAALAGVQAGLMPIIKKNQLNDKLAQVPKMIPGSTKGAIGNISGMDSVFAAQDDAGQTVGWVVGGSGSGFADKIELLIGFDPKAEKIVSLYVIGQKETPGLGDFITKESWRKQFAGKSTLTPLKVKKGTAGDPQEIEALTGATISSKAVTSIVNATSEKFRQQLQKQQP